VQVKEDFANGRYHLQLTQQTSDTANKPFHIPLVFGLLDPNGIELSVALANQNSQNYSKNSEGQHLLHLRETTQEFIWEGLSSPPVLSLNRQFSAPIRLDWDLSEAQLQILAAHDSDEFNRWEALQKLGVNNLLALMQMSTEGKPLKLSGGYLQALKSAWNSTSPAGLKAQFLTLPSNSVIFQSVSSFAAEHLLKARHHAWKEIAQCLQREFASYLSAGPYQTQGERALAGIALMSLARLPQGDSLALRHFKMAKNMTEQQTALMALCQLPVDNSLRREALLQFYQQWKSEPLVLNKWFAVQASSSLPSAFTEVQQLSEHADFQWKNPNCVYSLLGVFGGNLLAFPQTGAPTWYAEKILEVDRLNPSVATRLASALNIAPKVAPSLQPEFRSLLQKLRNGGLSKNAFEIVDKIALP
jgi:aminopeptidase N